MYSCMMHIRMCIQDSEVICAKTASTSQRKLKLDALYEHVPYMHRCLIWTCALYEHVLYMNMCCIWTDALYEQMSNMNMCLIWTDVIWNVPYMNRYLIWTCALYEQMPYMKVNHYTFGLICNVFGITWSMNRFSLTLYDRVSQVKL